VYKEKKSWLWIGIITIIVSLFVLIFLVEDCHCKELKSYSEEKINLGLNISIGITATYLVREFVVSFSDNYPDHFYIAKKRGLFEGVDKETHFVGGLGLYYWMRQTGNSKAGAFLKTCLGSLAWEFKDSWQIMNYKKEWYRKTSLGHVIIHFAGDGFDINDHYCVLLGTGTAMGFEYIYELYNHFFPGKKWLSLYTRSSSLGLEYKF